MFSDVIPDEIGLISSLEVVVLSNNSLQGKIPSSIGRLRNLQRLYLQMNSLNSTIPSELGLCTNLTFLSLAKDALQGPLPISFFNGSIPYQIGNLQVLDVSYNYFSGTIPSTITNLTSLKMLSLSQNNISGTIPNYFGKNSPQLFSVRFADNGFTGELPPELCSQFVLEELIINGNKLPHCLKNCTNLRIVMLEGNNLSSFLLVTTSFQGKIPRSLAMKTTNRTTKAPSEGRNYYQDSVVVVTKGLEFEVVRIFYLYTNVDLSSNKFEGFIPGIMGDLIALRVLNLSHNGL
ncbi:hypothetical protein BC332_24267 [Capsicum chinense]|nr:hypothetical protein BC332_24267 [Capsicum chinense]